MRTYQPSKFECIRKIFYDIMLNFIFFILLPTFILCYFLNIQIASSEHTETILWFWLVVLLVMLFIGFKKFDMRRAFVIQADEQCLYLQYYSGHLYFFRKFIDVKLRWENIERINNWHRWSTSAIPPILNTLFIHMKDRECYTIEIDMCSTLMKTIDKELNEMLKQYGEQKEEEK